MRLCNKLNLLIAKVSGTPGAFLSRSRAGRLRVDDQDEGIHEFAEMCFQGLYQQHYREAIGNVRQPEDSWEAFARLVRPLDLAYLEWQAGA